MLKKVVLSVAGLGGAVGLPYVCFEAPQYLQAARKTAVSWVSDAPAAQNDPQQMAAVAPWQMPLPQVGGPFAPPIVPLAEAVRFDVTTDWIIRRWPRVSTGLAELQLQGYRVALVTGTTESDLAGALTYYFNPQHEVQRISFRGTTGDISQAVGLLTSRYGLVRRLTNDPGLMLLETVTAEGKVASSAQIRTAPVLHATNGNHRYEVVFVLERPAA